MSSRFDCLFGVKLAGNMRAKPEGVSTRVVTRLRIMTEETARQVKMEYDQSANSVPRYEFGCGKNLRLHPSLQAIGRHYFTW